MSAQNIKSSTQKFTEIQDIKEDIVLLTNQNACIVVEIRATNFALLSQEEQMAKIASYAGLLNSLSFPIQIVIRNKKVDISSYVKLLEEQLSKAKEEKVIAYIQQYKLFVQELIKVNSVLEKTFYIVISYSPLEKGAQAIVGKTDSFSWAKSSLHTKADSLLTQLNRLSLKARVLNQELLIKLFYDIYNEEASDIERMEESFGNPIVKGNEAF